MKKMLTDKKARSAKKLKISNEVFGPWSVV